MRLLLAFAGLGVTQGVTLIGPLLAGRVAMTALSETLRIVSVPFTLTAAKLGK